MKELRIASLTLFPPEYRDELRIWPEGNPQLSIILASNPTIPGKRKRPPVEDGVAWVRWGWGDGWDYFPLPTLFRIRPLKSVPASSLSHRNGTLNPHRLKFPIRQRPPEPLERFSHQVLKRTRRMKRIRSYLRSMRILYVEDLIAMGVLRAPCHHRQTSHTKSRYKPEERNLS